MIPHKNDAYNDDASVIKHAGRLTLTRKRSKIPFPRLIPPPPPLAVPAYPPMAPPFHGIGRHGLVGLPDLRSMWILSQPDMLSFDMYPEFGDCGWGVSGGDVNASSDTRGRYLRDLAFMRAEFKYILIRSYILAHGSTSGGHIIEKNDPRHSGDKRLAPAAATGDGPLEDLVRVHLPRPK